MSKTKFARSVKLYLLVTMLQAMVFYAPVSALYRQYRGVSFFQMTLIESVCLALCILLEIPWGVVADRIGYKRTILICNAVFFVSKIVFWQADSLGDFMVERILLAVVFSGLSGVDTAYLARLTPAEGHQRVFGINHAMDTTGLIVAAIVFPFVLDEGYTMSAMLTMLVYGGALLLTLPMEELPIARTGRQSPRQQLATIRKTIPQPRLLLVLAGFAAMMGASKFFLAQLLYKRAGIGERWFSLLFILLTLAGLAAPLSGRITRRCGRWATPVLLMSATSTFCFVLYASSLPLTTILSLFGISLCFGWYLPWVQSWQTEVTPLENRATALSVQSSAMNLIGIGIELTFGRLSDISVGLTMGAAGIFCTAGTILLIVFILKYKER